MNLGLFVYLRWVLRLTRVFPPIQTAESQNTFLFWNMKMVLWGTEFYRSQLLPNRYKCYWTWAPHKHWPQWVSSFTAMRRSALVFLTTSLSLVSVVFLQSGFVFSSWDAVAFGRNHFLLSLAVVSGPVSHEQMSNNTQRLTELSTDLIWKTCIERKRVNQHKELILYWRMQTGFQPIESDGIHHDTRSQCELSLNKGHFEALLQCII